jgi:outer membrane protein assembly factor BamD
MGLRGLATRFARGPRGLVAGALALATLHCGHGTEADIATLASNSDRIVWEAGQKAVEKKNWEAARQYFKRIVDGFPGSELAPQARLALADTHFNQGGTAGYILAASAYREFLALYPSHPRADFAQYQVGESFFKQRNGSDRDQTNTEQALEEFQKVLEFHAGSTHAEAARGRIVECRQTLARHEFQVGYFYQRTRQACRSAIIRYEYLLNAFPDYEQRDEVLFRLAECLAKSGRCAEASPRVAQIAEDFPQSEHLDDARKALSELGCPEVPATAAQPVPTPSPSPPS